MMNDPTADPVASGTGLLSADVLESCPECGARDLHAVSDGELTNFVCLACGCCWHVELGWVQRVDPLTCPGCAYRPLCLASRRPQHLRADPLAPAGR